MTELPAGLAPQDVASDPPDDSEPPSFDDRAWHDATLDRERSDAVLPEPVRIVEDTPGGPPPRPPTRWSRNALTRALDEMARSPVDLRPLASRGYAPKPRLARHIRTRDQTCVFPDCRRRARECQLDHVVRYPEGRTCAGNLAAECVHHHQAKHSPLFTVERTADGSVHWTTRWGRTVTRPPRSLIPGR